MPRRPYLTPVEVVRITALCAQGLTAPRIAEQLDLTYQQVRGALRRRGLTPTSACHVGRAARTVPTRVVSTDQQQLIVRWQQSSIPVRVLAARLAINWRKLSHELRGLEQMSPTRLARLAKLLPSLPT